MLDDLVGVVRAGAGAAEVLGEHFPLLEHAEAGALDALRVLRQLQVSQHHDARQQQRRGVGAVLPGDAGRRAVHLRRGRVSGGEELGQLAAYQ